MPASDDQPEQLTTSHQVAASDPLWSAAAQQASKAAASVKADVSRRQESLALLTRLARAMSDNNVDGAARLLADPKAAAVTETYPDLRKSLDRVGLAIKGATSDRVEGLIDAIERHASANGWPCRRTEDGIRVSHLLEVRPVQSGTTKVQAKSVRSLSWEAVRPVLDAEHERLWGRAHHLGTERIERELARAIDELKSEASSAGHVQLRSVYDRMKRMRPKERGRVASYYRDEFSADLSLVKQSEGASRRFEFAAARDPRLAFEVVEPDGALLRYGYIRKR